MIRKREEKARRIYVVAHLLLLQEVPLALREGSSGSGDPDSRPIMQMKVAHLLLL